MIKNIVIAVLILVICAGYFGVKLYVKDYKNMVEIDKQTELLLKNQEWEERLDTELRDLNEQWSYDCNELLTGGSKWY